MPLKLKGDSVADLIGLANKHEAVLAGSPSLSSKENLDNYLFYCPRFTKKNPTDPNLLFPVFIDWQDWQSRNEAVQQALLESQCLSEISVPEIAFLLGNIL